MKRFLAILVILALGGVAAWLLWPKPVRRVPLTASAAGRPVTIEQVKWLPDGQLMVTLLVPQVRGWRLTQIGETSIDNGGKVRRTWAKTDADGTVHAELVFRPIDDKAGTFSIRQKLPYRRAAKHVTWRFSNVDPRLRQVTVRQAGMDMVLRRVYVNSAVDSNRAHGPSGYRWIARRLGSTARLKGNRYSLEVDVPTPNGGQLLWKCALSDHGSGRSFGSPDIYFDRYFYGVQTRLAMGGRTDPNLTERIATAAAPKTGQRLYAKRLSRAANQHRREIMLFAFPETIPPPKRVDVEVTGDIPVPGEKVVISRFDRVRMPKRKN